MPTQKAAATKIASLEIEQQALALKRGGYTYQQIADQVGTSRTNAWQAVMRAYQRLWVSCFWR